MLSTMMMLLMMAASPASALLVRSEGGGGLATGLAYDSSSDRVVLVGTTYSTSFWGLEDSFVNECWVAAGKATGDTPNFARLALESPEVCLGGTTIVNGATFTGGQTGIATVVGMSRTVENIPVLHSALYPTGGPQSELASSSQPNYGFSPDLVPVASVSDTESSEVFLGFHNEANNAGVGVSYQPSDNTSGLQSLRDYISGFTDPSKNDAALLTDTNPQIVKRDPTNGQIVFDVVFEHLLGSATLSSLVSTKQFLIMAGSTNGLGNEAFGTVPTAGDDWDGYVSFLSPLTGAFQAAVRFDSVGGTLNDYAHAACVDPTEQFVYVVGQTDGILEGIHPGGAWAAKIEVATRAVVWRKQAWGADARHCVADNTGVYLAGTATHEPTSDGKRPDDPKPLALPGAVVRKLDEFSGGTLWTALLDTSLEELTTEDGRIEEVVGVALANDGNLLVGLNSLSADQSQSDVFLIDMDPATGENSLKSFREVGAVISDLGAVTRAENTGVVDTNNNPVATRPPSSSSGFEELNDNDKSILVLAIVVPLLLAIFVCCVIRQALPKRQRASGGAATTTTKAAAPSSESPSDAVAADETGAAREVV